MSLSTDPNRVTSVKEEYALAGAHIVHLPFLEHLYQRYEQGEQSFAHWSPFFAGLLAEEKGNQRESRGIRGTLIDLYRRQGYLWAHTAPKPLEGLEPLPADAQLQRYYCSRVGVEFKEIVPLAVATAIERHIEQGGWEIPLSPDDQMRVWKGIADAERFEHHLHHKQVGKKRFSLEGADTLIPMLRFLITHGKEKGVREIVCGMAHRGRLNVMANVLGKPIEAVLREQEGERLENSPLMGDVPYHRGYGAIREGVQVTIVPNASHLESVDPIVAGIAHAKQEQYGERQEGERAVLPLLIHGDAALAGQGIVYETLQMNRLQGFETGGVLHLVINNRIGFTTSPEEGRSTPYCTDIAKAFGMPVFHIDARDPEICIKVISFALTLRQQFHIDVFIDLQCQRIHGHNEGDEPAFTQPLETARMKEYPSICNVYRDFLLKEGSYSHAQLEAASHSSYWQEEKEALVAIPCPFIAKEKKEGGETSEVSSECLAQVAARLYAIPPSFQLHSKLQQAIQQREKRLAEGLPLDWGTAEGLAYGTLLWEGIPVRLVGQDTWRGTFSHRHAIWVDQAQGIHYSPFAHLREGQGTFEVRNTLLSEAGALAFEYGYSTICTHGLTIWEAQFGDFVNGGQLIIDEYIATGEEKWGQASALVLLLPHGFEGEGPDHSSARLERFLSLAANDNMRVAVPSTPAQFFHLLRTQAKAVTKKPLIILTPKGLLRHPACCSLPTALTQGTFFSFLDDSAASPEATTLLFCQGRVFYEIDKERQKRGRQDLACIRVEQLYPFDYAAWCAIIDRYAHAQRWIWVQEEPRNMGAWPFIATLSLSLKEPLSCISRQPSGTPATGHPFRHREEWHQLLNEVFHT